MLKQYLNEGHRYIDQHRKIEMLDDGWISLENIETGQIMLFDPNDKSLNNNLFVLHHDPFGLYFIKNQTFDLISLAIYNGLPRANHDAIDRSCLTDDEIEYLNLL